MNGGLLSLMKAEWRKVIKVKSMGRAYQILVHLRLDEVELQKEEE